VQGLHIPATFISGVANQVHVEIRQNIPGGPRALLVQILLTSSAESRRDQPEGSHHQGKKVCTNTFSFILGRYAAPGPVNPPVAETTHATMLPMETRSSTGQIGFALGAGLVVFR
jgi:hypothetical protein